jgi:hypothetical protein
MFPHTLLREFETCIPKIPIAHPRFQIQNSYSQNKFYTSICGLFKFCQWGRRLECWHWSASCPDYYVLYNWQLQLELPEARSWAAPGRTGSMGCPSQRPSIVDKPDFDLYIFKKYSLAGVTVCTPILLVGPSFAVHAKCIFGKPWRKTLSRWDVTKRCT